MTFTPLTKHPGGRGYQKTGISASKSANGRTLFRFGSDVTSVVASQSVQVSVGIDDDAGFIRVSPANGLAGFKVQKSQRDASPFIFLSSERLGISVPAATPLPFRIDGDSVVIDIRPILASTNEGTPR